MLDGFAPFLTLMMISFLSTVYVNVFICNILLNTSRS